MDERTLSTANVSLLVQFSHSFRIIFTIIDTVDRIRIMFKSDHSQGLSEKAVQNV